MGKHLVLIEYDVTVGEVDAIILTNVKVASAWECGIFAHICGHILGDVANMMTIRCKYFDSIRVIGIGGFCLHGSIELTEVVVDILTV